MSIEPAAVARSAGERTTVDRGRCRCRGVGAPVERAVRGMLPAPLEESGIDSPSPADARSPGVGLDGRALQRGPRGLRRRRAPGRERAGGGLPGPDRRRRVPEPQQLADRPNLVLAVENTGGDTIPNLAVTIFTQRRREHRPPRRPAPASTTGTQTSETSTAASLPQPRAPSRCAPTSRAWRSPPPGLDPGGGLPRSSSEPVRRRGRSGAGGAEAAQTNTFAFGPARARRDEEIVWR